MELELETYNARMHAWEPVVETFKFSLRAASQPTPGVRGRLRPSGLRVQLRAEEEVRLVLTRDLLRAVALANEMTAGPGPEAEGGKGDPAAAVRGHPCLDSLELGNLRIVSSVRSRGACCHACAVPCTLLAREFG